MSPKSLCSTKSCDQLEEATIVNPQSRMRKLESSYSSQNRPPFHCSTKSINLFITKSNNDIIRVLRFYN